MAEQKVHFLNLDESLSGDGQKLVEFIESQFIEADRENNLEILNNLSGMIGHYYVNVYKARVMTPERWVKEYPNGAMNAWAAKAYLESQQQQAETVQETATKTSDLENQLNALKESLATEMQQLRDEIAKRDVEIEALKASKGKKPVARPEPTPEPPKEGARPEQPEGDAESEA